MLNNNRDNNKITFNVKTEGGDDDDNSIWSYLQPRKQLPPKYLNNITNEVTIETIPPPIVDINGNIYNNIIEGYNNNIIQVFRYIADDDKIVHHNGILNSKFNNIIITNKGENNNNDTQKYEELKHSSSELQGGKCCCESADTKINTIATIRTRLNNNNNYYDDEDDDDPMWGYENSNIPQPMKTRKACEARKKGFGYTNKRGNTSLLMDAFNDNYSDNNNNNQDI